MDSAFQDPIHEGRIARRRRLVREFLNAVCEIKQDIKGFYSLEPILKQLSTKEFSWTLLENLEDENIELRMTAAMTLLQMNTYVDEATGVFTKLLAVNNSVQNYQAAVMLSGCDQIPPPVIPALLTIYRTQNWFCRVAAACSLVQHHPEVGPTLIQALRADNPNAVAKATEDWAQGYNISRSELDETNVEMTARLQNLAACALGRRSPGCPEELRAEAVRVLIQAVDVGVPSEKIVSIYLLLRMGEQAKDALGSMIRWLESPGTDIELRRAIADVIGGIGRRSAAGKALVRPLLRALKANDWLTACNIVASLEAIGESPRAAILAMVRLIKQSDDTMVRRMAAMSLGKLGSSAVEFVPALIEHNRQEADRNVRMNIAQSIIVFGSPAVPHLIRWLAEGDTRDLGFVSEILSWMGDEAVEKLAHTLLTHPEAFVRRTSASIIRSMGPRANAAFPVALQLLRSGDEDQRLDSLVALSAMGHLAAEASTEIVNRLMERNPDIVEWASYALVSIGSGSIPALQAKLSEVDEIGQEKIQSVLKQIGSAVVTTDTAPKMPEGIEVLRDEAMRIIESLRNFQQIGQHCIDHATSQFSLGGIAGQIELDKGTLGNRMKDVSAFFRRYFKDFENQELLEDMNEEADETLRVIDRRLRTKPRICNPWGWRAWRLTCEFLDRRQQEIKSLRQH